MPTPRKHAKLIKKWADDDSLVIQFKDASGKWCDDEFPTFEDCIEFREKPKTIRYRVALIKNNHTVSVDNDFQKQLLEENSQFIKWIKDWVEVEI